VKWYVLHVLTGAELDVQRHLRDNGFDAVVLRESAMIRRGGVWHSEPRILFPGYVFVYMNYTVEMFYTLKRTPGAIRLLPKDAPLPLTPEDCAWLIMFAGEDILPPSGVDFSGPEPVVTSGPLIELEDYIVKYDRHRRRVSLSIPVLKERKDVTLSIIPT
jgi:transcriptional antiterminator NusG